MVLINILTGRIYRLLNSNMRNVCFWDRAAVAALKN